MKYKYYNKTNTCGACGRGLRPYFAHREIIKGSWTGRWTCKNCYEYFYNHGNYDKIKRYEENISTTNNVIELIDKNDIKTAIKRCQKDNCDRCGISFQNSSGTPLREIINGNCTGNWLCRQCYMKDWYNDHKGQPKTGKYNETNTCDRCGKNLLLDYNPRREYDAKRNWTGKWDCRNCYERFDPNSTLNIKKSLRDHRTGNLRDPTKILGDNCEELTYRWLGAKRLSVEYDNYANLPLDHSPIPDGIVIKIKDKLIDLSGKIPQTKGCKYDPKWCRWPINTGNEIHKEYNYLICYCLSQDSTIIDRIYIIPSIEITRKGISIFKTNRRSGHWYEKYRIICDEILKKVNEIWKQIIEENGIDDL